MSSNCRVTFRATVFSIFDEEFKFRKKQISLNQNQSRCKKNVYFLLQDFKISSNFITLKIIRQFTIMSKLDSFTSKQPPTHRISIRHLKLSKITKQIEHLQMMDNQETPLNKDDKENQMVNADYNKKYEYLKQSAQKKGKQTAFVERAVTVTQEEELRNTISVLESRIRGYEEEFFKMKEQKNQLQEIISYLKNENNFLREETRSFQQSQSRSRIKEEESISRSNQEESEQGFDKTEKFQDIYPTLLELHNENSLLVTKIMELTYGRPKQQEIEIQTQRNLQKEAESQTQNVFLKELEDFYMKYEFQMSFPSFLQNLTENVQICVSSLIERHIQPLKCEIQLLEQLIKSSKRQQTQKISYMTRLLQQSQKTIKGLMEEMKHFERQSKHNYSLYLSVQKQLKKYQ